ncbi:MAG: AAA family ATPase [Xenococcaceae cyanobacterium]
MFQQITLKNYRTHKSTTLELHPVTLLIGNNNSGKTNFLAGIQHFSRLIRRGNPFKDNYNPIVEAKHYFPHRHRLAGDDESMSIEVKWIKEKRKVKYVMELYKDENTDSGVGCREKIVFNIDDGKDKELSSGHEHSTNIIKLRADIKDEPSLNQSEKDLCTSFFRDLAHTFSYHFQASFLKGINQDKTLDRISYISDEKTTDDSQNK